MSCKNDGIIRVACRRSAAALAAAAIIFASVAQPACKAAALEITSGVAISALIAYLGASGITYSADGGDTADIITSIQQQISPYIAQQYGSEEAWLNDMRALSSPLGTLNGGLSISKPLCDMFEGVRTWLVDNAFASTDQVTVDHIAGSDAGIFTCFVNGQNYGSYALTSKVGDAYVRKSADWLGTGCYVQIPASFFTQNAETTIVLSAMPANQELLFKVRSDGLYYVGRLINVSTGSEITSYSFYKQQYVFIGLGRQIRANGNLQSGYYALYIGSDSSPSENYYGVIGYQTRGDLSSITTPSYTLTSAYDSSVLAPVVSADKSLVVPVGNLVSGVDSRLEDVLNAVQDGEAVYPDSRVDDDAANVAPAVYSSGEDYALDLTSFFPFCIPWDIDRGLRLFTAEPVTPSISWVVPLPDGSSYTLELDLHDYDGVAALARKLELILWVVGLAVATKYLIKW